MTPSGDEASGSPHFWIDYAKFNVLDYEDWDALSKRFPTIGFEGGEERTLDPDLIIFDALRSYHTGDENDTSHCSQVMARFRAYANSGATVVIIHHESKGYDRPTLHNARGSTVFTDVPDDHISLRRKERTATGQIITAEWAKGRGPDIEPELQYEVLWSADSLSFHPYTDATPEDRITKLKPGSKWANVLKQLKMEPSDAKALLQTHSWTRGDDKLWYPPSHP